MPGANWSVFNCGTSRRQKNVAICVCPVTQITQNGGNKSFIVSRGTDRSMLISNASLTKTRFIYAKNILMKANLKHVRHLYNVWCVCVCVCVNRTELVPRRIPC